MSDDNDDDLMEDVDDETVEDGELEAAAEGDASEPEEGAETPAPGGGKGKSKAAVAAEDLPSIEAKNKDRDALARAMEEFLSRGGKVQEIEPNVVADPPKKPDNKYGSRPI